MSRKKDLEESIRESSELIRDYRDMIRLTNDPAEWRKAEKEIARQEELIRDYLREYRQLCDGTGQVMPPDIAEIAACLETNVTFIETPTPTTQDEQYNTIAIRDMIISSFLLSELDEFCYRHLGHRNIRSTDYLLGSTLPEKAFALVSRAEREGWLSDLVDTLQKTRPHHFPNFRSAIFAGPQTKSLDNGRAAFVETVLIPAGYFWMGSADDDPDARPEEKPQRRLLINYPYCIGKYPITNMQYEKFVRDVCYKPPEHWPDGTFKPDEAHHPVTGVSYEDASAFCRWLSMVEGRFYRLPTEEEWEKAARGETDQRRYPWGNQCDEAYCNTEASHLGRTVPVGQYENASPFGVMDMAGNVAEWTCSWYEKYPGSSHTSPYFGRIHRVVRGGSWIHKPGWARVSFRGHYPPNTRRPYLGFRVVGEMF